VAGGVGGLWKMLENYTAAKQQQKTERVKKVCAKGFQSIVRRTEATGSQSNKN